MTDLETILSGGDLRSIGQTNLVVGLTENQNQFDNLFQLLFNPERIIAMRAADAIEKITAVKNDYLKSHKAEILDLLYKAEDKELKWHVALIVARLKLSNQELGKVWQLLTKWSTNKKESKIVRVNSLQALFNLLGQKKELQQDFSLTISQVQTENIPSINARIKKFSL